jgi:hypothetical protein
VSTALDQMKTNIRKMDELLAQLEQLPPRMMRRRSALTHRIDELLSQNVALYESEIGTQREQAALPEMRSGHDLARQQIAKHGRDRYPDAQRQMLRLMAGVGELAEELAGWHRPLEGLRDRIRREYAGIGLSYFELGNKIGLDAIGCMAQVVDGDERDFHD